MKDISGSTHAEINTQFKNSNRLCYRYIHYNNEYCRNIDQYHYAKQRS